MVSFSFRLCCIILSVWLLLPDFIVTVTTISTITSITPIIATQSPPRHCHHLLQSDPSRRAPALVRQSIRRIFARAAAGAQAALRALLGRLRAYELLAPAQQARRVSCARSETPCDSGPARGRVVPTALRVRLRRCVLCAQEAMVRRALSLLHALVVLPLVARHSGRTRAHPPSAQRARLRAVRSAWAFRVDAHRAERVELRPVAPRAAETARAGRSELIRAPLAAGPRACAARLSLRVSAARATLSGLGAAGSGPWPPDVRIAGARGAPLCALGANGVTGCKGAPRRTAPHRAHTPSRTAQRRRVRVGCRRCARRSDALGGAGRPRQQQAARPSTRTRAAPRRAAPPRPSPPSRHAFCIRVRARCVKRVRAQPGAARPEHFVRRVAGRGALRSVDTRRSAARGVSHRERAAAQAPVAWRAGGACGPRAGRGRQGGY